MRERIGSYRIERVLAKGGMGLVYKGRHETLGRDAAIKALLPTSAGDAALRQRLLREAQAQARLQHPNIVAVYDLIDDRDELFIAMEYVEGETLAARLDRSPRARLTLNEALPIFEQVLDALEYVHDEKIIHRDVKPSNVMVCGSRAKLADFGIALLGDVPRMTVSRQLIGSPPYMSPEQLQGRSVDRRTDIYSAALVLYRMVAGRPPFEAREYLAQIHERVVGPPDLRQLVPELPVGVCEAVAIALRHDPDQRFRSAAAFRDALREGEVGFFVSPPAPVDPQAEVATVPMPLAQPEPASRKSAVLIGVAVAGSLAAATFAFHDRFGEQSVPAQVPQSKGIVESATTHTVFIEVPAPAPVVSAPPPEPPDVEPVKMTPFSRAERDPADVEAEKRRELDEVRTAIRSGLERAENDLALERFDLSVKELDRIAAMAQADEFRQEREQIATLRTRVNEARAAAETRKVQDALWASQITVIEGNIQKQRWIEAESLAKVIANDPLAPEPIATRARALLQQVVDGRKKGFSDSVVGTTTNTIRKSSSPPRKEQ